MIGKTKAFLTEVRSHPAKRRTNRSIVVLIAIVIILAFAATAFAGATFIDLTGPTWLQPGYEWTVEVTSMSPPDHVVCLSYDINNTGLVKDPCTCVDTTVDSCNDGVGIWTCTIPADQPNSVIPWEVASWSAGGGASCGDLKNSAGTGTLTTGTNAVTLSSFGAADSTSPLYALSVLGLLTVSAGAFVLRRRNSLK